MLSANLADNSEHASPTDGEAQSFTIPRRSQMNTNDKFDVLEDAETVETVEKADTVELSLSDLDVVSGGGGVIVAFG